MRALWTDLLQLGLCLRHGDAVYVIIRIGDEGGCVMLNRELRAWCCRGVVAGQLFVGDGGGPRAKSLHVRCSLENFTSQNPQTIGYSINTRDETVRLRSHCAQGRRIR